MALLWALGSVCAFAEDRPVIGYVKTVDGDAQVVRPDGRGLLKLGDAIRLGDTVETGDGGTLGITFRDDCRVSLGPKSQLALREFAFDPYQQKYHFLVRLARGTMLYISGLIAKLSPQSISIETPVATVAVRGTRFLARVKGE
jgi:hypothetical protein